MKRIFSIILLALALGHMAGFMPFYFCMLQQVKTEMQLKISNPSELQKLVISGNEYNDPTLFKVTGDGEFNFTGEMYDYASAKQEGNTRIFYVLPDQKETSLNGWLQNLFEGSGKNSKVPFASLLKNMIKDFVPGSSFDFVSLLSVRKSFTVLNYTEKTLTGFTSVAHMPPNC